MQSIELFKILNMPPSYKRHLKSFAFASVRTSYVLLHIRMENTTPLSISIVEAMSIDKRGGLVSEIMRRAPLSLNHVTGKATGKLSPRFAMWRITIHEFDQLGNAIGKHKMLSGVYDYPKAKKKLLAVSNVIRLEAELFRKKHKREPNFKKVAKMVIHHTTEKYAGYRVPVELTGNYFMNHLVYMP